MFSARLLTTNETALKNCLSLLKELEDKGYLDNGKVVFEEESAEEVRSIFDRHVNTSEI